MFVVTTLPFSVGLEEIPGMMVGTLARLRTNPLPPAVMEI